MSLPLNVALSSHPLQISKEWAGICTVHIRLAQCYSFEFFLRSELYNGGRVSWLLTTELKEINGIAKILISSITNYEKLFE
jgi:hypothetical protein